MTATVLVPRVPHTPVRRQGPRPGSVHAAVLEGTAWATACGERLTDGPRGRMIAVPIAEAWAMIEAEDPHLCARCDRAGSAVG